MGGRAYTAAEVSNPPAARLAAFVIMTYDTREQLAQPDSKLMCHLDAPAPQGTGARFGGNVTGQIRLHNIGHEITALGRLQAVAVLPCSRCLREHEVPIEFDFCETCALTQIDEPGSYVPEAEFEEPAPIPILDGNLVDLAELARQLLVLNIPSRSLCSRDCKGLCPQCGADLNITTCECQRQVTDPRLAPLAELLHGGEPSERS